MPDSPALAPLLPSAAVRFLRSLGVWIVISAATVLFGLPAIPLALVPPRGEWFLKLARGWARLILAVSGVSVRVRHAERLEPGASYVIAPNHESFYDILVLLAVLPVSVRFLAKRNLFRLPILGWSMAAAGFIPVDRETRSRSFALVDAALARLRAGVRSSSFRKRPARGPASSRRSRAGAALLALRSELPLLPVGIAGTFEIQRRGGFTIQPSRVCLAFGAPIPTRGRGTRDRADADRRAARQRGAAARAGAGRHRIARGGRMSATAELTEEKVLEVLRTVRFPGLSRDIVSFGFVKDLAVGGGNVSMRLEIMTESSARRRGDPARRDREAARRSRRQRRHDPPRGQAARGRPAAARRRSAALGGDPEGRRASRSPSRPARAASASRPSRPTSPSRSSAWATGSA